MLRKDKMRVTMTKHKTPQGDVLVERRRKPREHNYKKLLRLTVLVSFLNQKYVEYHFGWWTDWDRETSFLGFLYGLYIDGPLSMNDLGEFYRETKTVQEEITKLIVPALTGDSEAETILKSAINENLDVYLRPYPFSGKEESGFGLWRAGPGSFAVEPPTFKAYVYGILANILQDCQLVKIATCVRDGCGKFFVRPDTKRKHCSSECYKSRDSKESGKRGGRELAERSKTPANRGRDIFSAVSNDCAKWPQDEP